MPRQVKISPSLMCADLMNMGRDVECLSRNGADVFHIDIMDGSFAPNITLGFDFIRALKGSSDVPADAHLMLRHPENFIHTCIEKGADIITVHAETCAPLQKTLSAIREGGKKAGVALSPSSHESLIEYVLGDVDLILVMSVNPGYSGQRFIPSAAGKIERIRKMLDSRGLKADLAVDGGMSERTIPLVCKAGASMIVAGSYLLKPGADLAAGMKKLKRLCK